MRTLFLSSWENYPSNSEGSRRSFNSLNLSVHKSKQLEKQLKVVQSVFLQFTHTGVTHLVFYTPKLQTLQPTMTQAERDTGLDYILSVCGMVKTLHPSQGARLICFSPQHRARWPCARPALHTTHRHPPSLLRFPGLPHSQSSSPGSSPEGSPAMSPPGSTVLQ